MKRLEIILLIVLLAVAAGCGQEEPTPTPEPAEAPTETPTPEPIEPSPTAVPPTETPEPTETPLPTPTPEPSPTPLSVADLIEMGDAQLLMTDWQGAEETYRQAIENEPENALALGRLAYLLQFHPETVDEAVMVGREAAELAPNDPAVVAFLVMALNRAGEYEEALEYADVIEAYGFNDPFALTVLADLNLAVGDFEEADRLIEVGLLVSGFAFGVERVEVDRIVATHAFLSGDRSLAIQYTNHLLEIAPQFAPAYLVRAQVLTTEGLRGATPRGLVIEGLTLDADYLPLMVYLAQLDAAAGNFGLALDSCEDVIRLFPDLPDGRVCEGNVLLEQEMYGEAQASFDQVVEQDSSDYRGYLGRGRAYLGLEDCETAESELQTALEYQPYAVQAYVSLGEVYQCLGNLAEAEAAYQEALALRPFDPASSYGLGRLYYQQGRYDDAGPEFLRAITHSPAGSTPAAYYASLGQTLRAANRCTVSGSSQEVTDYLCAGQFMMGVEYYLNAAEAFNEALALDESSVPALEGLVAAYANERLCDVALSFLIQLSDISEPGSQINDIYDANCTVTATDVNVQPDGELISEEEAAAQIETAVNEVEGVDDAFIFFDTFDFDVSLLGRQRVLLVQYQTDLERDSPELNRQLTEVIFAAVEGFVLTDSEPVLMFVQARTGLTEIPAGYVVTRLSSILWYNGDFSTAQFRQTWSSIDEILEAAEDQ